jgi:hypothetical protein
MVRAATVLEQSLGTGNLADTLSGALRGERQWYDRLSRKQYTRVPSSGEAMRQRLARVIYSN